MKLPAMALLTTALLAGCGSVPFRYDGPDAAVLVGDFLAASKTMVMEVNGERREPPFSPAPIKVRPGLLRVGLNLHNVSGQRFGAGCFELTAFPGSYHQFTVTTEREGFLVAVYQGEGDRRRLIGKAVVRFQPLAEVKRYCPA